MLDRLHTLAESAGLMVDWTDAHGHTRRLSPDVLRNVLRHMKLAADADIEIDDSLARLAADAESARPPALLLGDTGAAVPLPWLTSDAVGRPYALTAADGSTTAHGHLAADAQGRVHLPAPSTWGDQVLQVGDAQVALAIAPRRCFGVADALAVTDPGAAPKLWGVSAQVYGLRDVSLAQGHGLGGIGDFGTLARLCADAGRHGAAALLINPVHAGFAAAPERYSPYAPSNRSLLNPIYADPAAVFGADAVADAVAALGLAAECARLDALPEVDWPATAQMRFAVLRHLYAGRAGRLGDDRIADLAAFERAGGTPLRDHARFEALHAQHRCAWRNWPADARSPTGAGTLRVAEADADEIGFHIFAQWLAARSLAAAQRAARGAGMPIGLIGDLAVGADPQGSQAWSLVDDLFHGLEVGAPPDIYQPRGQGWGLTAFDPRALRRNGYAAYRDLLRATMAPMGGVRIDHALGLQRLWLVPNGASPAEGAYLRYPFDDLMRLIRFASWQHRAIVIGENLGTVPAGFNDRIAADGLYGTSVLWFERASAGAAAAAATFLAPERWPAETVATTTTHDLPTVTGWWSESDIDWQVELGLLADADTERRQRAARAADRAALSAALVRAGVADTDTDTDTDVIASPDAAATTSPAAATPAPVDAALAYVCATPSPLVLLPIEDLLGLREQPNLPGTAAGHPNWQRRLPPARQPVLTDVDVMRRIDIVRAARPGVPR